MCRCAVKKLLTHTVISSSSAPYIAFIVMTVLDFDKLCVICHWLQIGDIIWRQLHEIGQILAKIKQQLTYTCDLPPVSVRTLLWNFVKQFRTMQKLTWQVWCVTSIHSLRRLSIKSLFALSSAHQTSSLPVSKHYKWRVGWIRWAELIGWADPATL